MGRGRSPRGESALGQNTRAPVAKRLHIPGYELFPSLDAMVPDRDLQQLRRKRRRLSYGVGALSLPPRCVSLRGIRAFSRCCVAVPCVLPWPRQRGCRKLGHTPWWQAAGANVGISHCSTTWARPSQHSCCGDTKRINKNVKEELLKLSLDN